MEKLVSIDLEADFGFFRKPDVNSGINFSFNMIHKPVLLGILGAVIGLEGYREYGELPEYYRELKNLKIGIEPLRHEKGNFQKTVIKYSNTIGYANKGTTFLTEESTLIDPAFRCFILLDMDNGNQARLYDNLSKGIAEFLPYFGKNEHYAWWDPSSFREYGYKISETRESGFEVSSIFRKNVEALKDMKEKIIDNFDISQLGNSRDTFMYFERLPIGLDEELHQYELGDFAFTTFPLLATAGIEDLYYLENENKYIQLF